MRAFTIAKKVFGAAMLSLIALSFFGSITYAAIPDCTKEYCALTTIPGLTEANKVADPVKVITNIYGISIGIGAILAVIMIIWAGVEYATTEAITGKSDAKEKWQGALFGLILLLASFIILKTINVDLVNINLDLGTPAGCKNGVSVGVDQKPITDAAGKTVACQGISSNAFEKMLDQMNSNVSQTTNALRVAEQNVVNTEKLLEAAKAKVPPDPVEIASIENTLKSLRMSESLESIYQRSTSISQIAISNILSRGGEEEIANAQKLISQSRTLMQKDLDELTKLGASADILSKARTSINVVNNLNDKILSGAITIKNLPTIGGHDGFALQFDKNALAARSAFQASVANIASAGEKQNPDKAADYNTWAKTASDAFDKALSNRLNCKVGINFTPQYITCTK